MSSNDQSKLMMNSIAISDSFDSSSDDIIPMQRRKRQRSYSKRRNIRGSPSSSMIFKSNYTYGLCTLVKFIFLTFVIGALSLSLSLSYNLYNRLELLQVNIDGLQSTKSNLPEEMHLIHSHLKKLDQNSTQLRTELSIALDLAANMTNDIAQMQAKLQKISESIEAAPTIAQLPKDVDDLKKIVADLGSKMATDDKEVKLAREQQASQDARLIVLESKVKILESNITSSNATVSGLKGDLAQITANLSNFKALLSKLQDHIVSLNETTISNNSTADALHKVADPKMHVNIAKKDTPTEEGPENETAQPSDSIVNSNM